MKKREYEVNLDGNGLIERDTLLSLKLGGTKRGGVPVRCSFVQLKEPNPETGKRVSMLPKFVNDGPGLDAYLLIHAMASSSDPYGATEEAVIWAQLSGLLLGDMTIDSARQRWSRAVRKLKDLKLITSETEGRRSRYTLLNEVGNGEPYVRPDGGTAHGNWISLPHKYWLEGYDQKLETAGKIMLLIALDQKDTFNLVRARVPEWYGVSPETAKRGFRQLENHGILLSRERTVYDRWAPKSYVKELTYSFRDGWKLKDRKAAMTKVRFSTPSQKQNPDETASAHKRSARKRKASTSPNHAS